MIDLKSKLDELVDEKYKQFHSGLCPGTDDIMGVRLPNLRKLAREIENSQEKLQNKIQ